ncbi:ATP-binding protein [Christensenella sp. NSJ-35]|uniref:ATP-binding protein n=2 Tax=Christensenella tenuis TaxID=2763033 RepID=A0ABR7EJT3_9FIRM|nr:ATP-binding protein [Christensenella tenuis]MBC5649269.1 ATP-binding protein [Christensenella tenuis]
MENLQQLVLRLHSLVLFHGLLEDPVVQKFMILAQTAEQGDPEKCVAAYSDFCAQLFTRGTNFSDYLLQAVLESENLYILKKARGAKTGATLEKCLKNELAVLQELAGIQSAQLKRLIPYDGFLPDWDSSGHNFLQIYKERIAHIGTYGYGLFSKYHFFTVSGGELAPVKHPDETRLSALSGYEYERGCVVKNTLALLEGKPAANVLLYGDSGTGKSSTVKAVVNEFAQRGLRLIEIRKNQLRMIPALIDTLGKNPLKFILFIDDLSFTRDDDDFGALKAILEGSVSARTKNLAVYATSNRRHLVRETFSEREGDEVHANDTIQQLTSLSDRFGLTITFSRPNREQYFTIIDHLSELYGVKMDSGDLHRQAEIYALERGGRSPRVAKQFLEQVQSIGI